MVDYQGHDGAVGEREVLQVAAARSVHWQRRRRRRRRRRACRRRRDDFSAFTHSDIEEVQAARRDVEGLDTLHGTGAQNACSHLAHVAHCQYGALGCGEGGGSTGRVAAGSSLPNSKTRASFGTTSSFECKGGKLVKCCLYAGVQGQRPRPACASSGRAAQFSSCRHASPLRSSACALIEGTGHLPLLALEPVSGQAGDSPLKVIALRTQRASTIRVLKRTSLLPGKWWDFFFSGRGRWRGGGGCGGPRGGRKSASFTPPGK